jgi:transposase
MTATHTQAVSVREATLYVAFELSAKTWKLACTSGFGVTPWVTTVRAGDWSALARGIAQARTRLGVAGTGGVMSCYEAGRDGFWIHHALERRGFANRVVDSASIEVNRRRRRAKTDRLDALKLVTMLVRVCLGEAQVWREVRVPSAAVEAARHASRERTALVAERTRGVNQIRSLLATVGAHLPRRRERAWWTTVHDGEGAPLPVEVQGRVERLEQRLTLLDEQIAAVEARQRTQTDPARRTLVQLKGIATTSAAVLVEEGLVWRAFRNRREVGGFLGFAPVPYQSGDQAQDQGIDRAGNSRLRAVSIQLAWNWVRWQPASALTRQYQQAFAHRGGRLRRIGIVALARKLLIALWRYVTQGIVPPGALLKPA